MRIFKKYKNWSKINNFDYFPSRISKFKKIKWKQIKSTFFSKLNRYSFGNYKFIHVQNKGWGRVKNYHKEKIHYNNLLKHYYGYPVKVSKNSANIKNYLLDNFIKLNFKIDSLLHTLCLSSSLYESRELIRRRLVIVNGFAVKSQNIILKKGDIVFIENINRNIRNFSELDKRELKFSFVEIDYYTQSFILLKNKDDITLEDISFNLRKSLF